MSEASVINDLICSIGRREIFSTHCQSRYNWGMELNWNGINFVNKLKWWKNFRGKMWQTALENTMHIFYVQDRKQHTNYAELIIAKQRLSLDAMIAWMHIVCTLHGLKKIISNSADICKFVREFWMTPGDTEQNKLDVQKIKHWMDN